MTDDSSDIMYVMMDRRRGMSREAIDRLFYPFFRKNAPTCVQPAEGQLKYRYVIPSYGVKGGSDDSAAVAERSTVGHYPQMYDWDSCFFSQVAPRIDIKNLATDVVSNFLSLNHGDGYIPRTVSPGRIWDAGDMCKPFLAQTLLFVHEKFRELLPTNLLSDLDCYLEYYVRTRQKDGLFHWRNVLESGIDDNLALLAPIEAAKDQNESVVFPDGRLLATDLCAYLFAEFKAVAAIADAAGNKELAAKWTKRARDLSAAIDERMWNEKLQMYCNVDPVNGQQVEFRACSGLMPAFFDAVKPERIEQVFRSNVLSEQHFLRPTGVASVAVSENLYNQAKRGLYGRARVSNWQGPMWILPNGLAVRALARHGLKSEAQQVAHRAINTAINSIIDHAGLFENYNAETGAPLWAPNFMSWNILILEMLDQV